MSIHINIWLYSNIWLYGKLNFYMTQMISGHGCFREYLYRFKIVGDPFCPYCSSEKEDDQHVLFSCSRFDDIRCKLQSSFWEFSTVANFTRNICSSLLIWLAVQTACKEIFFLRSVDFRRQTNEGRTLRVG